MYMRRRKKKTLDRFLIIDFMLLVIFTIVCLAIYCVKGSEPEELIRCFFACFGAENGFMAIITVAKTIMERKGDDKNE